jgi:hypothetical protein
MRAVSCPLLLVLALLPVLARTADEPARPPIQSNSPKVSLETPEPERAADKSIYNLFNPTPRELMRDMSTDRPDKTESAYTLDAGHFQFEMDVFAFTRDRRNPDNDGTKVDTYTFAGTNLKMGLTNNIDLQFVFEPLTIERSRERDADGVVFHETRQGFGDITTRVKFNIWGNDCGMTALAIMPFFTLPTSEDNLGTDQIEGGIIVPLAVALPYDFSMGVMTEVDFVRNEDEGRYDTVFINTITFSHDLVGNLGAYIEFFSAVNSNKASRWEGTVDLGFTYAFTDDIQLDWGVNVGVTRAAEDINPFLGLSMRF